MHADAKHRSSGMQIDESNTDMNLCDVNNIRSDSITTFQKKIEHLTVDNLGTCGAPRGGECKFGKCATDNGTYSLQEERELLPKKHDLAYDQHNVTAAHVRLKDTERRLSNTEEEYAEACSNQREDMIARGTARKLSSEKIANGTGPRHHQGMKPDSSSTPMRIVYSRKRKITFGYCL